MTSNPHISKGKRRYMKPIRWISIIFVVLVVLGGGYWYMQSSKSEEAEVTITPVPNTQDQPNTATESPDTSSSQNIQVSVDTITLKSVGNYTGSGTATRIFANGTFTHTVNASIGDPDSGKFYEGWLVNMSLTPKFFSTGKLQKDGNSYKLSYTNSKDYSNYSNVVITEEDEANGLDGVPEAHVLEGEFSN